MGESLDAVAQGQHLARPWLFLHRLVLFRVIAAEAAIRAIEETQHNLARAQSQVQ